MMPFTSGGMGSGSSGGAGGNAGSYYRAQGGSVSGTAVVPGMMDLYNQLLGLNMNNYQNILGAYSNANTALDNQMAGINNTLGMGAALGQNGNWGVAKPAADAIAGAYSANRGRNAQSMINSGLGNSTLMGQMQNQAASMASQSYGNLGAQLANTAAGYQAQIAGMRNQLAGGFIGNLAGHRFANTAGDLTGGFGASDRDSGGGSSGSRGGSSGGSGYSGMQDAFGWADNLIGAGGRDNYSGGSGNNQGWYGGYGGGGTMGGGQGTIYPQQNDDYWTGVWAGSGEGGQFDNSGSNDYWNGIWDAAG